MKRAAPFASALVALVAGAALIAACSGEEEEATLTREQLLDPTTCANCHAEHYREWSGSMHAYAAEDPVFLAMNARFQRESDGSEEAKSFCVKCHAPLAVHEGATVDGLNLPEVPSHLKGITCYSSTTSSTSRGRTTTRSLAHGDDARAVTIRQEQRHRSGTRR